MPLSSLSVLPVAFSGPTFKLTSILIEGRAAADDATDFCATVFLTAAEEGIPTTFVSSSTDVLLFY